MAILGPTVHLVNSGLSFEEAQVELVPMFEKAMTEWKVRQRFEEELRTMVREFKNRKIDR